VFIYGPPAELHPESKGGLKYCIYRRTVAVIYFKEVNTKLNSKRKRGEALLCSTEALSEGDGKHHDKNTKMHSGYQGSAAYETILTSSFIHGTSKPKQGHSFSSLSPSRTSYPRLRSIGAPQRFYVG
jgi:hypothetical protein